MEGYLGEEKYEAELCKQMARTIADVAKARVKELLVHRCKYRGKGKGRIRGEEEVQIR